MSSWEVTHEVDEWLASTDPTPEIKDNVQVEDKVPEIKVAIPDTRPAALMPNVKDPVLNYRSQRYVGRGSFQASEYNLSEIGRIEDTDGYVRQAFSKKVGLMFKEGWDLIGKNPRTIKYVKTRLEQIAQVSKTPTNTLFRKVGSNVIRKSNAFLLKVRKTEASGGRVRTVPGKVAPLKPVAAYFSLPAESLRFKLSGSTVSRWKQDMPNGDTKEYAPKDVIHITNDKKDGFIFGTPTITPVVDDIRALRKIEENLELLIYQHLFPLFQYKVGTEAKPAGYTETGEREIEVVRREIMFMPTEGGIVTPERHEITAIGAEGRALRAEGYVDHFKKRVFSGLGVSAVDMGEGETANRATADNMSRNLVDGVKDLQQIVEDAINQEIINELLLESTFGPEVLNDDNLVKLRFKEIDVDAKIKKENHIADLFGKDSLTWDEARRYIGEEPIIVPTPEEIEVGSDTAENFPEWHKTRWKLFEEPKLLIQSIDEPYSPAAKASAASSSLAVTEKGNQEAIETKKQQEIDIEKEKTKAKVAVAKAKPKPPKKKDGYLKSTFIEVKQDTIDRIPLYSNKIDHDWIATLIRTQMNTAMTRLLSDQLLAFRRGYASISNVETEQFMVSAYFARSKFSSRAEHYIAKLTENIISSLRRNVVPGSDDMVEKTRAVFDSLEYRTSFIEDVEVRKALTFGTIVALRDIRSNKIISSTTTNPDACPTCQSKSGIPFDMEVLILDSVPPYHANCTCQLQYVDSDTNIQDSTISSKKDEKNMEDATLEEGVKSKHKGKE